MHELSPPTIEDVVWMAKSAILTIESDTHGYEPDTSDTDTLKWIAHSLDAIAQSLAALAAAAARREVGL